MHTTVDLRPALEFLGELRENNNKAWFGAHRAEYERARQQFEAFVARLIDGLSAFEELGGVSARDCIMRIYRDVRFSRDKSPYRSNMGASIGPGGRKSATQTYYFQLGPYDESMLAGGLYDPSSGQLDRFRAAVAVDAAPFKRVVSAADFVRTYGIISGERLKTAPQGYERDHPEIELLRLKQVVALHAYPDAQVLRPGFADEVISAARALKPFLDYLNAAAGPANSGSHA